MELSLFVYLTDVIPSLGTFCTVFAIISFFVLLFLTGLLVDSGDKKIKPLRNIALVSFILCSIFALASPSQKTMYLMAGAYAGQSIAQSDAGGKVMSIINLKLDEYVEDAAKKIVKDK